MTWTARRPMRDPAWRANGGDGNLVEISPSGSQVGEKTISPGGGGALFGLALSRDGSALYFVDDSENQLNVLR